MTPAGRLAALVVLLTAAAGATNVLPLLLVGGVAALSPRGFSRSE
jgi:hypothetical protein